MAAPTFISAATSGDGAEVNLTYSETLGSTTAPPTAFNVSVDGSQASIARATTSGSDVILSLTSSIQPGRSVSVRYTAPLPDNSVSTNPAVQDVAGNDASSLNPTTVTNNSTALSDSSLNFSSTSITTGADSVPQAVAAADFNNDRILDLVVTDAKASDSRARVYIGNGTGGFTSGGSQPVGQLPWSITANDFDGDGNADVAIVNTTDNSISVILGDGLGNLSTSLTIDGGPTVLGATTRPRYITNLDCDLDGMVDLAWTISYGPTREGKLAIVINNGTSNPFLSVTPTLYTIGQNPYGLVATDLNSDGKADLIAANSPNPGAADVNGSISVLLNRGDGTFQSAQSTSVGIKPRYLSSGDYNRDGWQDLALTLSENENKVQILLGNGSGNFSSPTSYALGSDSGPRDIISKDFNADGILDLAVSTIYADSISVLLGNGSGSFGNRKVFAAGDGPVLMASGDFNLDGLLDLTAANNSSSNISVLLNGTVIDTPSNCIPDNTPPNVAIQLEDNDRDGLREAVRDVERIIIDGNRDGFADADQSNVIGIRLAGHGSFADDYGAITAADGVIIRNTRCVIIENNDRLNISGRSGISASASLPAEIVNSLTGILTFQALGMPPKKAGSATLHLPANTKGNPDAFYAYNFGNNAFQKYADSEGRPLYTFSDANNDGKFDVVQLSFCDGDQRWDRDGVANGFMELLGFTGSINSTINLT